jgi:hypothetical protein
MKRQKKYQGRGNGPASIAIAGAGMLAATLCGGCLYTIVPAMAGPSTTYQQPANSQPAQSSQTSQTSQPSQQSGDQTNQNKQQNGAPPNGTPPQGQGGTP